ncbi:hypothetical protein LOC67_05535 [Stieleria sp. JC731]|uniref:ABC transporter permease n=1 Tax=Pirellulaceae TaxID=2691357 RepID=UPI001E5FCDCE|nr:hypothetical protein [Stieleria sp. JC731]MCC9600016.1 hypothetical protein [Stieleria sp. JC731]
MAWLRPLLLTLELMSLSMISAVIIGVCLAFALSTVRRDRPIGKLVYLFCMVGLVGCLATPLVMHAAAWESTAGKFGWLSLSQTAARTYSGIAGRYTGVVASVWIHGLYGSSIVALATLYGTARVPRSILDTAMIDGGPIWCWWRIRLPIAKNWVFAAALATGILAASEMTVVDLYGMRTLADEFYLFHTVDPSLTSILIVLVIPCLVGLTFLSVLFFRLAKQVDSRLLDQRLIETREFKTERRSVDSFPGQSADVELDFVSRTITAGFACFVTTLMFAFPLAGIVVKVGQQTQVVHVGETSHVEVQWSVSRTAEVLARALHEFSSEYLTTIMLAVCTATLCVVAAWGVVSRTQHRSGWKLLLDGLSVMSFLIPGPLVGLAIVRMFSLPVPGLTMLYQQTLLPTILALSVRTLPVGYWVLRSAYLGIDQQVKDASQLDLGWIQRFWIIERSMMTRPLTIAFVATLIMASGDVPASLPVIPPGVVTVGTRLFGLLHSGARYQEASLAFWYLLFVIIAAIVLVQFTWRVPNPLKRWKRPSQ